MDGDLSPKAAKDGSKKEKEKAEIEREMLEHKEKMDGAAGIPAETIAEFREIFNLVDDDHSGEIGVTEMLARAKIMKMEATEEEIEELVRSEGGDDMVISFDEFVRSLTTIPKVSYTPRDVKTAFARLAGCRMAGTGHIKVEDLIHTFTSMGEGMSLETCNEMIAKIEVKKDGTVNFDEYVTLMMTGPGDAGPGAAGGGGGGGAKKSGSPPGKGKAAPGSSPKH